MPVSSYKQDRDLEIPYYVNKVHAMFFITFWKQYPCLDLKCVWQTLKHVYLCLKQIREITLKKELLPLLFTNGNKNMAQTLLTYQKIVSYDLAYYSTTDTKMLVDH